MSEHHWTRCSWGDLAVLEYGKALRDYRQRDAAVRVYGTNGPIGWTDNALGCGPTVVVGRKGAYRGLHYAPGPFWVIDTAYWLRPTVRIDTRWAYYQLLTQDINGRDSGSAIPSLSRSDFATLPVDLPPLSEQRAIAEVLGALDDKIEANKRMAKSIQELLAATWSERFSNPPGEWERREIGELVEIVGGSTPRTSIPEFWDGGVNWATPKDLSKLSTRVLRKTKRTVTESGLSQISSGLLPAGTVLLSSRAPIGYLAVARIPVAINQGFIALRPNHILPAVWLLEWLASNMGSIRDRANGTTFQEISKASFRPIPVAVPPDPLLRAWAGSADALFDRLVAADEETEALAALRDTLLPKLLSGELRVHDAKKVPEEMV